MAWGVELSPVLAPLHFVQLTSKIVSGQFQIAVRPQLPVAGVDLILGSDLAGEKVFPSPEVVKNPIESTEPTSPSLFPVCAVTPAQSRKLGDVVDLGDSFLSSLDPAISLSGGNLLCENNTSVNASMTVDLVPDEQSLKLSVDKEELIKAQKNDATLSSCFSLVETASGDETVSYLVDSGVLLRRWSPPAGFTQETVTQIVVPQPFRSQVLALAHDHSMLGHLGIHKTYNRVLRYFFWPGLKTDVTKFCQSCHVCQIAGKPNQKVPVAPIKPIPIIGEPFEHVIIDCVGPLPKTKSGNQYILTMMCAATRYPEAVLLRTLKSRAIVKALLKFFSTFGLPQRIQSDQGTNLMSKVFSQVLSELNIKYNISSAYHPESQGALEHFHQTLKSMLRKFCSEQNREWDDGLPLFLFAVRETAQESLGFSPADLVFGHSVRGPLRLLH